jgi:hypothetical protein
MVESIISIGAACCALVYAVIMTILIIVKNVRSKGLSLSTTEKILEELPKVWCDAEEKFKTTFGASVKSGVFKLDYALGVVRDMCDDKKIKFDRTYWSQKLSELTEISNTTKGRVQQLDPEKISYEVTK